MFCSYLDTQISESKNIVAPEQVDQFWLGIFCLKGNIIASVFCLSLIKIGSPIYKLWHFPQWSEVFLICLKNKNLSWNIYQKIAPVGLESATFA